jgi:3',5'-cyclic-AMP phosphodiesterase
MRIAFITDPHFGPEAKHEGKLRKLTRYADTLTRNFVERMNAEFTPDLVVNLGDVIEDESPTADRENYRRFLAALSGLKAPLLHVAGNHDQVHLERSELAEFWGHTGPLHYTRDFGPYRVIVLRTDHGAKDVRLEAAQIAWLESTLAEKNQPTLVFLHHPLCEMDVTGNPWFERQPNICRVAERRKVREILERSAQVLAVFNGHVHWNYLSVINGIPYFTIQSLTENIEDDAPGLPAAAWAVAELSDFRLEVRVHGEQPVQYGFPLGRS